MAVELAARNECSAEAGKLAARCSEHLYTPVQQKMQSTEEEAGELKEKCAYFQALVGVLENQVKNVRNEVEGQKADLAKLWEQIDGEMAAAKDLHDQEMAAVAARHAQEMVAAKDLHDQEMAAAAARHAQEMAAVKREYNLEYLESMGQPPAEDSPDSDTN